MRILLLSTFLLSFTILFSQNLLTQNSLEECGVTMSDLDYSKRLEMKIRNGVQNTLSQASSSSGPITFAVAHHIFLTNDGNPNSNSVKEHDIHAIMSRLNNEFNSFGIYLESVCIQFHNDSRYNLDFTSSEANAVLQEYGLANAYNVFYTKDPSFAGRAQLPWNSPKYIQMNADYIHTMAFEHEFGHALGLFHTHNGPGFGGVCVTKELVNGSNCATTGDYICDTPADPGSWRHNDGNCNWDGDCRDNNGQLYNPDASNIMSYAPRECKNRFTFQQKNEMRFWANSSEWSPYILDNKWDFEIAGPSHFCSNEVITLAATEFLYSGYLLNWTSSPNLSVKKAANNTFGYYVYVSRAYASEAFNDDASLSNTITNSNNKGWVEASYISYCGEKRTVRHDIWIGEPEIRLKNVIGSCENKVLVYEALPADLNYTWFVTGGVSFSSNGNLAMIRGNGISPGETESFNMTARFAQNGCVFSNSLSSSYSVSASCGSGPCLPGNCPCPINDPNCNSDFHQMSTLDDEIWIFNTSNEEIFHGTNQDLSAKIKDLPPGLYIITTKEGSTVSKKKILVGDN